MPFGICAGATNIPRTSTIKKEETEMAAKVDSEKCLGCEACKNACPAEAIVMKDGKAFVKEDDCLSCGACEGECPVEAIKVQ